MAGISKRRKFDGKIYTYRKGFSKKTDVEKYQNGLKKRGNLVRRLKQKPGSKGPKYLVYARQK